ncbi:MAG: outer membrane beta-barrel protein [Bacteroidales bacterium]|nr:outer membrane beta-barrel protein [Bacteroidales bacterium]
MVRRIMMMVMAMAISVAAWGQITLGELQKKANAGDAESQFTLAMAYYNGDAGLTKSYTEAVKWFKKAAAQNHAVACYNLAVSYKKGYGVTANPNEAMKWCRKSAELGFDVAQYDMGRYYEDGELVKKSGAEVVKWYTKAAEQGHVSACTNLGAVYAKGELVDQDIEKAKKWLRLGADKGDSIAQYDLGYLYDMENENELAIHWYTKSAEQGNKSAQFMLGDLLFSEATTSSEGKVALNWIKKAAAQGDEEAIELIPEVEEWIADIEKLEEAEAAKKRQAAPKTTYSYTPKKSYNMFNEPYWDERWWGLSIGYVQKHWLYKPKPEFIADYGDVEEIYGVYAEEGEATAAHGIQMGIRYEPEFGHGFGLNTGLFYEFYTDHSMDYYDDAGYEFKTIWEEHSLNIPLHLEFRANFDEAFQLFAYGGGSVDLGLSSTMSNYYYYYEDFISDKVNVYGRDVEMLRFNASWEAGFGVRFNSIQLQCQMSRGLINMAERDAEYVVFQNKPLTFTLSWMF